MDDFGGYSLRSLRRALLRTPLREKYLVAFARRIFLVNKIDLEAVFN